MSGRSQGSIARFGVFEADLQAGELRRSGLRIKVQEKPFRILALLLHRPGEVVSREELRRNLWPDGTFVDFDSSLGTAVGKLRQALGDSAVNPRFIETLPGRGYRFIFPVVAAEEEEPAALETAPAPVRPGKKVFRLAAGLAALALAVWFVWHGSRPATPTAVAPGNASLKFTRIPGAYRAWVKGRSFARNAARVPVAAGIGYLQEAVHLDPGFGRAWSSLAIAHIAQQFYADVPSEQTLGAATMAARKALALDPRDASAWQVLGETSENYDWDHLEAERDFRKAIELAPNSAAAKSWYSEFLLDMRRFDEALVWSKLAADADPAWLEVDAVRGNILLFSGKTDQAIAQYLRVLESEPNFGLARVGLGLAYVETGRNEEGLEQLRRGDDLLGHVAFSAADLGYGLARAGHRSEAGKMRAAMIQNRREGYYPAFAIGRIEVGLGDEAAALGWLEKAVTEHRLGYYLPAGDPVWMPVRSNPRFQAILRRMNLGLQGMNK